MPIGHCIAFLQSWPSFIPPTQKPSPGTHAPPGQSPETLQPLSSFAPPSQVPTKPMQEPPGHWLFLHLSPSLGPATQTPSPSLLVPPGQSAATEHAFLSFVPLSQV